MAGVFEVFVDADSHFRFRLKAPDGTVMAVSRAFGDKPAAVAGIAAVRECAGTGLITDLGRGPAEGSVWPHGRVPLRRPAKSIARYRLATSVTEPNSFPIAGPAHG
jgi:uncharacterized protein YegP (UPF0339 family)